MRKFSFLTCVVSLLAGAGVASATEIKVAILTTMGSQPFADDVKLKIGTAASFFNIDILNVDTSTPDLVTVLDTYAAVMVIGGNNPFQNADLLGTNLDLYLKQ